MLVDCMLPCATCFNGLTLALLEDTGPSCSKADLVCMDRTLPCTGCSALQFRPCWNSEAPASCSKEVHAVCMLACKLLAAGSLAAAPCSRQQHLVHCGAWPE